MSSGNNRDNFGGSVTMALFAGLAIGAVIGIPVCSKIR